MAQLNENLIRAMVWDLKEVVSVSIALTSWMGKIDCMSWRYPSKQSQSVDVLTIFNNLNGSAGEYYVNLLEFIYDRLVLILNLLIKFVDNFPNPSAGLHVTKNLIRPQHLSLGGLLNIFWCRMQSLQKSMVDCVASQREPFHTSVAHEAAGSIASNISHTVVSRNCQTDLISLASCENCHLNGELMSELIKWTEFHSLEICKKSAVAIQRQAASQEVVHSTQWLSMHGWASAIVQDLNTLLATFKEANAAKDKSTKLLSVTENKWERRLQGCQDRIKDLKTQCRDLTDNLTLKENELSQVDKKWQQTFSDIEKKHKILEKKLQLTDELLAESVAKEKKTQRALQELQQNLDQVAKEKTALEDEMRSLRRTLRPDLEAENVELRGLVHRLNQQAPGETGTMRGNPVSDMLDQVRANQVSIQRLQAENTRLAATIDKLHAFQARHAHKK